MCMFKSKSNLTWQTALQIVSLHFILYCFFSFYLIRERDELMDHVTSLKSQLKEMVQREEDAYQQMKKGIQLVEQAQLEQTEVCDWFLLFHSYDGLDVIL